jgi:arachidonate 15-lipoxygenase
MFHKTTPALPSLPQNDPDLSARTQAIDETRGRWRWDAEFMKPLVLMNEPGTNDPSLVQAALGPFEQVVPKEADPGAPYVAKRVASLTSLLENDVLTYFLVRRSKFDDLTQYQQLFVKLPPPRIIPYWREDAVFAYQRIGGANPLSLRRLDDVPPEMAIDDKRFAAVLPAGRTLRDEIKAGNIFIADYSILDGIPATQDDSGPRYTMPVLGLFRTGPDLANGTGLAPVAIQLGIHRDLNKVIFPTDGKAWMIAKMALQSADVNFHEMGPHLLWAHFMLEPFACAVERQLSPKHPVAVLLKPHFRILIWNNFEGRELLVSPGGLVSQLLGGGLEGSMEIIRRSFTGRGRQTGFTPEVWDLPMDIAARGLDKLPSHPYRDDGMLLWNAIHTFVTKYLALYYRTGSDLANDREIQAWAADLASIDGAHVPKMPSSFATVEDLARMLTRVIFASGPFHSALNFTQYEFMAYAPNMPASLFAPMPEDLRAMSDADLDTLMMKLLPPPAKAKVQVQTVVELTSYRYDQFGRYQPGDFIDPAVQQLVGELDAALETASATIQKRNLDLAKRPVVYDFLVPANILNSASI